MLQGISLTKLRTNSSQTQPLAAWQANIKKPRKVTPNGYTWQKSSNFKWSFVPANVKVSLMNGKALTNDWPLSFQCIGSNKCLTCSTAVDMIQWHSISDLNIFWPWYPRNHWKILRYENRLLPMCNIDVVIYSLWKLGSGVGPLTARDTSQNRW